ncbi:nicotinate-nucleotide--dimethylbenzimidazole phosphoribosyltransferase [Peribacillus deserti]|uniref:Nicotinate-nucleotide--dimethylbenzimidazole phosphoribosyltransferase n=1 Tax=Peribacillus deserti TaxID=673318 RepID=A0A2N5M8Y8_9BACI|nr:nicotinate-nucleotide--dimethylbenzimidazole phosphoribosyltransferase [Peribacillus deserti]
MYSVIKSIEPVCEESEQKQQEHLNSLTKPVGSLGALEDLAVQLAGISAQVNPEINTPGIIVFASDHGISLEGVSAYPQEVTAQMVRNFLTGGAAINVFSKRINALLEIVDIGIASELTGPQLIRRKIAYGTKNFLLEDAMSEDQAIQSIWIGMERAKNLIDKGAGLLILGEMGIGNTSPSSAIIAFLTGCEVETVVGLGTGIEEIQRLHKIQVIKNAIIYRQPLKGDPINVLAKIGGFEIGAIAGSMLYAASRKIPILLDGFISTAGAVLAAELNPLAAQYMIAGHQSAEPGHRLALEYLNKRPLLHLGMRLGEGSGAALSYPLVAAAADMARNMATFEQAGVSRKS